MEAALEHAADEEDVEDDGQAIGHAEDVDDDDDEVEDDAGTAELVLGTTDELGPPFPPLPDATGLPPLLGPG